MGCRSNDLSTNLRSYDTRNSTNKFNLSSSDTEGSMIVNSKMYFLNFLIREDRGNKVHFELVMKTKWNGTNHLSEEVNILLEHFFCFRVFNRVSVRLPMLNSKTGRVLICYIQFMRSTVWMFQRAILQ